MKLPKRTNCAYCQQGDSSITVTCYACRARSHLHWFQLKLAPVGAVVMVNCFACGTVNAWERTPDGIRKSGPVLISGEEEIIDYRLGAEKDQT